MSHPLPGLDESSLERWLASHLPDARAPYSYQALAGGHSNLTYRMIDSVGTPYVLRRPPLGTQPIGSHDMAREFRIQRALRHSAVPVPTVEVLCEDSRVIGAPFYIMRWVDGDVIDSPVAVSSCLPSCSLREVTAEQTIKTLAAIHQIDIDSVGLDSLGLRNDFVARQTERMRRLWEKVRSRDVPLIDALYARLVRRKPPQKYTGLVHNDYRLGNLIISAAGHVNAVLDWELATIGDVLVDIGALLNNWDEPQQAGPDVWMQPAPTRAGGFPDRSAIVALYSRETGFDVEDLNFYRALSYWRIAIIGEGMRCRYESGDMSDRSRSDDAIKRLVQGRVELADFFLPA